MSKGFKRKGHKESKEFWERKIFSVFPVADNSDVYIQDILCILRALCVYFFASSAIFAFKSSLRLFAAFAIYYRFRFFISLRIYSLARQLRAMIWSVGFLWVPEVNEAPSTTNRFLTSHD